MIHIPLYIKGTLGQGVLYENKGHTLVVGHIGADLAILPTDNVPLQGTVPLFKRT